MLTVSKRIIRQGWLNFSRDGSLIPTTVFIMVITILLVSSLFLLRSVSQVVIASIREKADISVYFKETSFEEEILSVKEELSKIPEIKDVEYVSREQALKEFSQRHKDDPVLMESIEEVGGNPFLPSLNIKAWEASQYTAITNLLEKKNFEPLVEKIDYYQRKPVIDRIFSLSSFINRSGIILSLILMLVAVLIVFNTIRLTIYNSREEIKIQRLVGASNWFVRGPFLVQGAVAGIIAALISLLIFSLTSWLLSPRIETFFPGLNIFQLFTSNLLAFFLLQMATGIGLGVVSSLIAVRRYLKV